MPEIASVLAETDAPTDRSVETLDVRDLPPPEPLTETVERLTDLSSETILVQYNDRTPQHLYPKLEERGYRYATVEGECTLTAIWWE